MQEVATAEERKRQRCVPCPEVAEALDKLKKATSDEGGCEGCRCRSKFTLSDRQCKYVQPERRKSFKPLLYYERSNMKIENPVYKDDYTARSTVSAQPIYPKGALKIASEPMSGDTTTNTFYQVKKGERRTPIVPRERQLPDSGPIDDLTVNKRDYTPKTGRPRQPYRAGSSLITGDDGFDDATVSRLAYSNPNVVGAPPRLRGKSVLVSSGKFDDRTVTKLSFRNLEMKKPDRPEKQQAPLTTWKLEKKMSWKTVYSASYMPNVVQDRTVSCKKKISGYVLPKKKMEENTTYRKHYKPHQVNRQTPVIQPDALTVYDGRMSYETVNRMSYRKWPVETRKLFRPCEENHLEKGPMETVTTQKNDYPPKTAEKLNPYPHEDRLQFDAGPVSGKSTTRLSYAPFDVSKIDLAKPLLKPSCLNIFSGKMDHNTVQKVDYKPHDLPPKKNMPWISRNIYKPPDMKMDFGTTHSVSYTLPGKFVKCQRDHDIYCKECPQEKYVYDSQGQESMSCQCKCTCLSSPAH